MTKTHEALWTIQWLLAALFVFAGAVKLVMPVANLSPGDSCPALSLRRPSPESRPLLPTASAEEWRSYKPQIFVAL